MPDSKHVHWRKLDNAAKIFPATSSRTDTRVFRFYCELSESVNRERLQAALERTVERYPLFLSVMRKGLFWYYLEKSSLRPVVKEEEEPPCISLFIRDRKSLLFEVTYYQDRINLEVFHALTDGTGAMQFLKELAREYLALMHPDEGLLKQPLADESLTPDDHESDGFAKYYSRKQSGDKTKKIKSFQLSGPKAGYGNLQIMEGVICTNEALKKAREYGVSLTVFLTSVFLCAIEEEMSERQKKRPVILMVPVNLRKFFPSSSMLNFFGWIEPGYLFDQGPMEFKEIVESVGQYFKEELTKERLAERMAELVGLERNPLLRMAPLELKNLCINLGARLAKRDITAIFSNMGVVSMPAGFEGYIKRFGVFISTPKIELCMCSYEEKVSLSFTSCFQNSNIQRNFFRILNSLGLETEMQEPKFPIQKEPGYPGLKFFQWTTLLCIAAAVGGIMVNVIATPYLCWSAFAAAGIFTMWLALAVGFFKRHNLLKNGLWQLVLISGGCLLWDEFTGWNGWSVDYVIPCVSLIITVSMMAVSKAQRLQIQEYMTYFVIAGLFGMLPLILLVTGIVSVSYPSVICAGLHFLFLTSLAIFRGKEMYHELCKKLHF